MKHYLKLGTILTVLVLTVSVTACKQKPASQNIILATTTSTYDSGLLDYILPIFTAETGRKVDIVSVGTGAALQMGREGQADVLLVHALEQELKFMDEGHGVDRFDVMYNDFIVVGPQAPIAHNDNIEQTFRTIAQQSLPFVSRGDNSGTHTMELSLWKAAGVEITRQPWYNSVGQGMGETLIMANEMRAFTLTDRATWLKQPTNLVIVCEKAEELINYYGVISVNPSKNKRINWQGAQDFIDWILLPSTQDLIGSYGMEEFGSSLFTPNAMSGL